MFQSKLLDGTIIEDTYPRGIPLTIRLGGGQVIKGLEDGLVGMCIGEIRNLTIPASMAYGPTGIPPLIPPNSILLTKIELVEIEKVAYRSPPNLKIVTEQKDSNPQIEPSDETNNQNKHLDETDHKNVPYPVVGVAESENIGNVVPYNPNDLSSGLEGIAENFGKVIPRDPNFFKIDTDYEEQAIYERYYRRHNSEGRTYNIRKQTKRDTENVRSFNYGHHNNEL